MAEKCDRRAFICAWMQWTADDDEDGFQGMLCGYGLIDYLADFS